MPFGDPYIENDRSWLDRRNHAREEITRELIAKGLTPGAGKWGAVFCRKMRKRGF